MTEPAAFASHRPTTEADPEFVGPPEPVRPSRQHQLLLAQQVHGVASTLLNATSMLEAMPEETWAACFELVGEDLADTASAAAQAARIAYEKALAIEVLVAKAMR